MANDLQWLESQLAQQGVLVSAYIVANGISHDNIQTYIEQGQLQRLSIGLYGKEQQDVSWPYIVNALQHQQLIPVRLSGITSLKVQGMISEPITSGEKIQLVSNQFEKLPKWAHEQSVSVVNKVSRIFSKTPENQLTNVELNGLTLVASSVELSILEYLEQVTDEARFGAALKLIQSIESINIDNMLSLLIHSASDKANRLFLHFACKTQQKWAKAFSEVPVSDEVVTVIRDGIVDTRHNITIPAFYPA
ncbi:type IV toxin-antitoxin system AbiEi family antitoxin domain-containing protein [Alteromonas sp. a30]|uniref:type IV toxin-antitoxin system AbiEi family antitoxin domain-containing protein n=1 Tax=Alteromonas sp. a30 TaxID=2730917 RepID=UPI00227F0F9E|nr:type IV toxin-antitoxin system AbiEi family antitoxin domain-containing protein [Alteromonas sp. a30]MCY7296655.1 hypothetical protein [Alteromonas sp. a30]